ncbi:MAG TPA: ABC transporter permease [Candidatus Acidoferrales bacterium]|jgi:predicted permease|nr:ABC transporter permease [Candidatus Acidoferrales bacterium]
MNWFWNAIRQRRMRRAVAEEIESHLEEKAADLMEAGMPEREARLTASREFGNVALLAEASRDVWAWIWLERLLQDVRHGLRLMARSPGFTTVAVLSLALGIGANTAIFGLLDKIVWRALPVRNPDELRIVEVVLTGQPGATPRDSYSYPQYQLWRDHNRSFTALAATNSGMEWRDLSARSDKAWHQGQFVSGNYFDVLGVRADLGRVLTPADDSIEGAGGPEGAAAVVSYRYWRAAYHADPGVVGKQINVNGVWLTIVGVTPPGFLGIQVGYAPDVFIPMLLQPVVLPDPGSLLHDGSSTWVWVLGRLKPGFSDAQAKADLTTIYEGYEVSRMSPSDRAAYLTKQRPLPRSIVLAPGSRGSSPLRQRFSDPLMLLMALGGIVLLIACANIASLLLARGNARGREIAVRLAIGAPRGRIVRQFLTESGMLALAGGAIGLLFALWSSRMLLRMLPQRQAPIGLEVIPDIRVLAFIFGVSVSSVLLFGLAPAVRATRHRVGDAMKQSGPTGPSWRGFHLGKGLAAVELALALPLLAGAGLFIGTFRNLNTMDAGFQRENVLQARIDVDRARIPKPQWRTIYEQLVDQATPIPGVRSVSLVNHGLLADGRTSSGPVHFQGYRFQEDESRNLLETYVGPDYFTAAGIPLRMGRIFTARDGEGRPRLAIVNETLMRQYFAGRNPVGLRFGFGDGPNNIEIVGVVADAKYFNLRQDPVPMAYYPWQQAMPARMDTLIVRIQGDTPAAAVSLRNAILGIHPDLLQEVSTLSSQLDDSLFRERMLAQTSGFFGGLALALTCIGLYGIMAYAVSRRTREIGIRIALGALPGDVIGAVLGETLMVAVVGLAVGVPLALGLTRLATSFLYGVKANDPQVLGVAVLAVGGVSFLAGWFPARRAARVDAAIVLRHE